MHKIRLNLQTSLYLHMIDDKLCNPTMAAYYEHSNTLAANRTYRDQVEKDIIPLHPDCNVFWTDSYDICFWSHGQCDHIRFGDIKTSKVEVWWNSSEEEKHLDPSDFDKFREGENTYKQEFETQAEADAFCDGLQEAAGWMGDPAWKKVKFYK